MTAQMSRGEPGARSACHTWRDRFPGVRNAIDCIECPLHSSGSTPLYHPHRVSRVRDPSAKRRRLVSRPAHNRFHVPRGSSVRTRPKSQDSWSGKLIFLAGSVVLVDTLRILSCEIRLSPSPSNEPTTSMVQGLPVIR